MYKQKKYGILPVNKYDECLYNADTEGSCCVALDTPCVLKLYLSYC